MQSVREFLHMQKLGSTSSRKGAVRRPWERGEGFHIQNIRGAIASAVAGYPGSIHKGNDYVVPRGTPFHNNLWKLFK